MLETSVLALVALGTATALFLLMLLMRRMWALHRHDRELNRGNCPKCSYPLRFNGVEHWCSECGYRHPVKVDPTRESSREEDVGKP